MDRPNILFVILDSCRPEWLSCYRPSAHTSPNIDRLAEQSLVFETAISPSAWTFPVMASVFTGMVPTKHGGHDEHQLLDSAYPTLAEVLQHAGYQTVGFADVPYVGPSTRLDRGFDILSNLRAHEVRPSGKLLKALGRVHRRLNGGYNKLFETHVLMGEVFRWLNQRRDPQRPFFLYIHTDETHAPFLPPPAYRRQFTSLSRSQMYALNQDKQLYVSGQRTMTEDDFAHMHALARAEVAYFDAWLGRLLDRLRVLELLDNMIVVIAADHGDNIGEHGLLRHGLCLYDTLLHVPLILKLPASRRALSGATGGRRVREMVKLIDLFPTIMGLAGIDDPQTRNELQGQDLVQAVRTGRFDPFCVAELYRPGQGLWRKKAPDFMPTFLERYDRRLRAIRTATHKFIWSSNGRHELYDLVADPAEAHNVVHEQPDLAATLSRQLQDWLASFVPTERTETIAVEDTADERVFERLRELGYVE